MLCGPHCSHLSTILNNIVDPESGVTILFNIVGNCEQRGPHNIVQSCFRQYCNNRYLIVFSCVRACINRNISGYYHERANYDERAKIKYNNNLALWPLTMASKRKFSSKITLDTTTLTI
jgi:hypothetical protein